MLQKFFETIKTEPACAYGFAVVLLLFGCGVVGMVIAVGM